MRKRPIYRKGSNLALYRIMPNNMSIAVMNNSLFEKTNITKAKITDAWIKTLSTCRKAEFITAYRQARKELRF